MTTQEKLEQLKKVHVGSDPQIKALIHGWEDELIQLRLEEEWLANPNTEKLRDKLVSHLNNINDVLSNDPSVKDNERQIFFKTKDIVLTLLAVLTREPQKQINTIEKTIDNEIL